MVVDRRRILENAMHEENGITMNSKLEKIFKLIDKSGVLSQDNLQAHSEQQISGRNLH
jgi:hypothetical protein